MAEEVYLHFKILIEMGHAKFLQFSKHGLKEYHLVLLFEQVKQLSMVILWIGRSN